MNEPPRTRTLANVLAPPFGHNGVVLDDDNARIGELNRRIEAIRADFASYRYVELGPRLVDPAGRLRVEFSDEGLHLTIDGHLAPPARRPEPTPAERPL